MQAAALLRVRHNSRIETIMGMTQTHSLHAKKDTMCNGYWNDDNLENTIIDTIK